MIVLSGDYIYVEEECRMVLKKVSDKSDVRWIDPGTLETKCSWNTCFDKFNQQEDSHEHVFEKTRPNGKSVDLTFYYHECRVCKRRIQSKTDVSRSKENYRDFKSNNGEWLPSTDKERLTISKLQTERVRNQ